eukprot:CAMPEP_0194484998 /NCGR_PEP_ID=MMETSP0253-20130528/6143_1 /TAXON_ID=2966 /ORGANISM="Noctiluca scintillans" /LENGTH=150 /DNA_ID=CAMNT_0039324903 /DNA_START=20 /DNA_END=472 /DNA_ORIENTATION=-
MSMSCSSTHKDLLCSDANLAVDGKTHTALFAALSASGVDTTGASIGALSCSDRRLTEASERRLEAVYFMLSYTAWFTDYSLATTFASDLEPSSLATAFEYELSLSYLSVHVFVTEATVKLTEGFTSATRNTFYVFSIFVSLAAPMFVLEL